MGFVLTINTVISVSPRIKCILSTMHKGKTHVKITGCHLGNHWGAPCRSVCQNKGREMMVGIMDWVFRLQPRSLLVS